MKKTISTLIVLISFKALALGIPAPSFPNLDFPKKKKSAQIEKVQKAEKIKKTAKSTKNSKKVKS